MAGRRALARFCTSRCKSLDYEARGRAQREATLADEHRAERADATRHLDELHARRAVLLPDADDALIGSELSAVDGQIRAAERRLSEQDAEEGAA